MSTPVERTYTVPVDTRSAAIHSDSRTYTVPLDE